MKAQSKSPQRKDEVADQFRYRLYRIGLPSKAYPGGEFTEVWDNRNYETRGDDPPPPEGELKALLVSDTLEGLLNQVKAKRIEMRVSAPCIWLAGVLIKDDKASETILASVA